MKRNEEPTFETDLRASAPPTSHVSAVVARRTMTQEGAHLAHALDVLLVAVCELPIERGTVATATAVLDALALGFPRESFGVVLADAADVPLALVRSGAYPESRAVTPGTDGSLFPGEGAERVLVAGPTARLHVAAETAEELADGTSLAHLAARAAVALERGLAQASARAEAQRAADDLRALHGHVESADRLASVGQIAAGVVHELANPLTSIVAYTDYLLRKDQPDDDAERLRRIGESAGRILRLSRDLVSYARPSEEAPVVVRLETVVERAVAFCEHEITTAGASVERSYEPETLTVAGLPDPLTQVFVNLVTNACHAVTGGAGHVRVRVFAEGDEVVARVEDDGHGIAEENLARVFAPFFTTKAAGRGNGLGLSIVKNIVEKHDARIAVASGPEGTAFEVRFRSLAPRG